MLASPTPARQTQRPVNHRHGRGPRRHGSLYCDKRSDGMKKKKGFLFVLFLYLLTYFLFSHFPVENLESTHKGVNS